MSKKSYPTVERLGASVVVTARSTVEAQQVATDALGTECTITHVEKVHEGGIGGFFATELVRVTAQPARSAATAREAQEMDAVLASADEIVSSLRAQVPHFADRLLAELEREQVPAMSPTMVPTGSADRDAVPFDEALSRLSAPLVVSPRTPLPTEAPRPAMAERASDRLIEQLLDRAPLEAPTTAPAADVDAARVAPIRSVPERVERVEAPTPTVTGPAHAIADAGVASAIAEGGWSAAALRSLGVPDRIVDAALEQRPTSEGQWIVALMTVLRHHCGVVPTTASVTVGPAAANLARQLRLVSVSPEELAESVSSVALPNASAKGLLAGLHGRHVHLVVGGSWQHLVGVPAHVVSAANRTDLLAALRVASAWDAVLGWYWCRDRYERIDEFCLVEAIRTALRESAQVSAL